jgi:hypothetical protein
LSKLLINGCSYTTKWNKTCSQLGEKLGFDETVCIGLSGRSNDGIFRSTFEHILNHSADFVILSLTFWNRQEAPWAVGEGNNCWTDYSIHGVMRDQDNLHLPREIYAGYIKDRYTYDISTAYIDKFLYNIIIFAGWLDSMGIRYLIFSAPEESLNFEPVKLAHVNKNPRILDINQWSSNIYMYQNGGNSEELKTGGDSRHAHYDSDSYKILNDFLYNYIIKYQL